MLIGGGAEPEKLTKIGTAVLRSCQTRLWRKRGFGVWLPAVRSLTVETAVPLCMGESHAVTVTSRISDKFQVRSNGGAMRVIVCMEEQIEGVSSSGYKYQSRSGFKTYQFEGGEPAAKIGDAFLDRTGQIYRRITPDSQQSDLPEFPKHPEHPARRAPCRRPWRGSPRRCLFIASRVY
jgi:hypothetical protein